jgi:hypothetical protein
MDPRQDIQSLIGEVAKRHSILIRPDDPAFVILTLNELWLERFTQRIETALENSQDQMTAQAVQQRETAKLLAEQAITGGADYVANTARAAIDEFRTVAAGELAALRQAAADTQRERHGVLWAVALLLAVAVIIGLAGVWLGAFEPR